MKKTLCIMCLLCIVPSQILFAKKVKTMRIAVLDIRAENAPTSYGKIVRDLLEINLHKTGSFEVLERNQVNKILMEQGFQASGCAETSCAVQIGKILSADYIVIGSISRITRYTLMIKFIDVNRGNIVIADDETTDSDDGIEDACRSLSEKVASFVKPEMKKAVAEDRGIIRKPKAPGAPVYSLSTLFGYSLPLGDFRDLASSGYSGWAVIGVENLFFRSLYIGMEGGYSYFPGADAYTRYYRSIPLLASLGYSFTFFRQFYIRHGFAAGVSFNSIKYNRNLSLAVPEYVEKNNVEALLKTGFEAGYRFGTLYSLLLRLEYNSILESSGMQGSVQFSAGAGIYF